VVAYCLAAIYRCETCGGLISPIMSEPADRTNPPQPLLDQDGYPYKESLQIIEEWQPGEANSFHGLMDFIHSLWWCPEWGFYRDGTLYRLSTGGWSGNESIIEALERNRLFWMFCWRSSHRGGRYEFEVKSWSEN
jgi:hypothetical protein